MNSILLVALFPPLFVIFAWATLTIIRYSMPERKIAAGQHRRWLDQQMSALDRPTIVGAHDIREYQRRLARTEVARHHYLYRAPTALTKQRTFDGLVEDLWNRRN